MSQQFDVAKFEALEIITQLMIERRLLEQGYTNSQVIVYKAVNELVLRTHVYIHGQKATTLLVSFPKNWWEAFKERWFPKLLLKRSPVKYTEYSGDFWNLYPVLLNIPGATTKPIQIPILKKDGVEICNDGEVPQ